MEKEKLKEVYEGKIWINNHNTVLIKLPTELTEHKDFPLKHQRTIAVIPQKKGLVIRNLTVE